MHPGYAHRLLRRHRPRCHQRPRDPRRLVEEPAHAPGGPPLSQHLPLARSPRLLGRRPASGPRCAPACSRPPPPCPAAPGSPRSASTPGASTTRCSNDAGRLVFPVHAYRDARTQAGLHAPRPTPARPSSASTPPPASPMSSTTPASSSRRSSPAARRSPTSPRAASSCPTTSTTCCRAAWRTSSPSPAPRSCSTCTRPTGRGPALDHFHIPAHWFTTPDPRRHPPRRGARPARSSRATQVIAVPGPRHRLRLRRHARGAGRRRPLPQLRHLVAGRLRKRHPAAGRPRRCAARVANERIGDGRYRPLTNVIGLWLLEQTMKDFAARPQHRPRMGRAHRRRGETPGAGRAARVATTRRSPTRRRCGRPSTRS